MDRSLETHGYVRSPFQTPLEFAVCTQFPEAVSITEEYNRVRFGGADIQSREEEVASALERLTGRFK